mmetsp:Transcript_15054/g.29327  ORF Transcript_15054/g.29327 Transcript_15054/m.29327 type:complete len:381 (+) Transcript_15054:52-1194(+)|eukprot:CAMPEP_0171499102 /NCGR_PEP_ID=MMETSP0958-20121227/8247_1 /TAXON_ID=87120 /ORGANISM="Aurantiochytrium limacinum, Strain ATCCMYA-1381" /LENGTH=380 /DNA_ID=CAMNT_0012033631 /DNA_START=49 /DNA_END=1191 /DNA_ORIENTATION=+
MTDAAARPTVSVFDAAEGESKVLGNVALPAVLTAPIRTDVVHFVHSNVAKNRRQAYAVKNDAGMEYAAESWGTGRAVSRIPRVPGGGTHRSGQAAFGNMCRGGRMFNPTRIWRKWHRAINVNERRYATASALAASAVPALVMARGHRISQVPEMPLVIGGEQLQQIAKTKQAMELLDLFGASEDVDKVKNSKKLRSGKGKMRNRRYVMRRGPLLVHDCASADLPRAFRNVPGVELCNVNRLNILQLAPGGHVGRFVIYTQDAFEKLDSIFGTLSEKSEVKKGFALPRSMVSNADIDRIINSEEIQKVVRDTKSGKSRTARKKNPLRNLGAMIQLNPHKQVHRRAELAAAKQREERQEKIKTKRESNTRTERQAFYKNMLA